MGRLDVAKYSQNIDNTGSTENENQNKIFVGPVWRGKKKPKDKSRVSKPRPVQYRIL